MSDSIGDILYILVMVAALVFSIIRKARSGNQTGEVMPESEVDHFPREAFPSFDDWLDKDGTPKEPKQAQQAVVMQPEQIKHQKLEYKKPDYKAMKKSSSLNRPERITRITKKVHHKSLADEEVVASTSFFSENPFDLRSAIIFSEILKRPTF